LKTGSLLGAGALGPKLGIPLARLLEDGARDVRRDAGAAVGTLFEEGASDVRRFDAGAAAGVVEGVLARTSDALDALFCSDGAVGVWLGGRDKDDTDGFLRSCSVEAGARS
jgi:hypothetical protein